MYTCCIAFPCTCIRHDMKSSLLKVPLVCRLPHNKFALLLHLDISRLMSCVCQVRNGQWQMNINTLKQKAPLLYLQMEMVHAAIAQNIAKVVPTYVRC